MADIFISYKSERRSAARHLAKVLGAYGYDAWYDYGLIPGEDFEQRLIAEMAAAKVIVVLWCSLATDSDWVNTEAQEAMRTSKYLPCRIEDTPLPEAFALADTISLMDWDGAPRSHMLDRLLGDISRRLGRDPAMDFNRLRELDEDWRGYGAPSLAQFALGKTLMPEVTASLSTPTSASDAILTSPPEGITPALAEHWRQAQSGDSAALFMVAKHYRGGEGGLPKDIKEAARLYDLAAAQGHMYAQADLGFLYAYGGDGVPQDETEAVRLYKLAAEQGNDGAQANLAVMYRDGRGVPQSDEEAVRLFRLAAERGNMFALSDLGYMYETGRGGLPRDAIEAAHFYERAANKGNDWARERLKKLRQSASET